MACKARLPVFHKFVPGLRMLSAAHALPKALSSLSSQVIADHSRRLTPEGLLRRGCVAPTYQPFCQHFTLEVLAAGLDKWAARDMEMSLIQQRSSAHSRLRHRRKLAR